MMSSEELEKTVMDLKARVIKLESGASKATTGEVAPDSELDSQYGDPAVRKDPPLWVKDGKQSFVGCNYSGCTPEYLDALSSFLLWKAAKDDEKGTEEGTKYARYARKDSARALGWAKRIRNGWVAPVSNVDDSDVDGSDIPFS